MTLIDFWAAALGLSLLLYVILDGFDLGAGMLFPFAPGEESRRQVLAAISPVWDGNETWLVIVASILFGAFPSVYALLLSAFYLPLLVMLAALIFRGVAFEFRYKSTSLRPLWDCGFVLGSYLAAFAQGTAVGAIVEGLAVKDGRHVGGPFAWASSFAMLCGVGLCIGYALIGACWIAGKGGSDVRAFAFRVLPWLMVALVVFLITVFSHAFLLDLPILKRWTERPLLVLFPMLGAAAFIWMALGVRHGDDRFLFGCSAFIFLAAFATLVSSFWPYMVPFSITVEAAAAPETSLRFLFWGAGLFALPITLLYTAVVYYIFRGRVRDDFKYH